MRRITVALLVVAAVGAFAGGRTLAPVRAASPFELALDCDPYNTGVQTACSAARGTAFDVAVTLTNNSGAATSIASFNVEAVNHDISRLLAPEAIAQPPPPASPNPPPDAKNANPDFNDAALAGPWACQPLFPLADDEGYPGYTGIPANPATQHSFIACFDSAPITPALPAGASLVLATVHYNVPAAAPLGAVSLGIENAGEGDNTGAELGSCAPVISTPQDCLTTTVNIVAAAATLSLDCNTALAGVQSVCHVGTSAALQTLDVGVQLKNDSGVAASLSSFDFETFDNDTSRLLAVAGGGCAGCLDSNPDFNQAAVTGTYSCTPPLPSVDDEIPDNPATQHAFLSCFSALDGPTLAPGASLRLATVHYRIPAGARNGTVTLATSTAFEADNNTFERGSCSPVVTVGMACPSATVILYCKIMQADVDHNGTVNSTDLQQVAARFGQLPAPANYDQNFDGAINSIDLFLVAAQFGKTVSACV